MCLTEDYIRELGFKVTCREDRSILLHVNNFLFQGRPPGLNSCVRSISENVILDKSELYSESYNEMLYGYAALDS